MYYVFTSFIKKVRIMTNKLTSIIMYIWMALAILSIVYCFFLPTILLICNAIFAGLNLSVIFSWFLMKRDERQAIKIRERLDKRFEDVEKEMEEKHNGM